MPVTLATTTPTIVPTGVECAVAALGRPDDVTVGRIDDEDDDVAVEEDALCEDSAPELGMMVM